MKGQVEKIDAKNPALVEINLGSDAGLEVGHTLEVFRLKPTPRYLGTLRIVAVMRDRAAAQFSSTAGGNNVLRVGDQVASMLK